MFAVQCSFCQHENVPGARFCAECGSPLHLRVCPNAQCGKVSDVNAERCQFCGTPFPKIALADPGVAGETASSTPSASDAPASANSSATDKKASISAWPLVVVAIVAGGLPLLWFNRSSLPTPKTWQTSPEVERLIKPPVLPAPATQNAPSPAAAPTPAPAPGSESLTLPPLSAPIQPAAADKAEPTVATPPVRQESTVATNEAAVEAKPAQREQAKTKRETAAARQPKPAAAAEPTEPTRPCTEAAAALGLCDPKQAKR